MNYRGEEFKIVMSQVALGHVERTSHGFYQPGRSIIWWVAICGSYMSTRLD